MKILIVNDDSIAAPGIALLAKVAMSFGEVTVVAPAQQCSAMSQKLTIHGNLGLNQAKDFPVNVKAAYSLEGTPVDCVKVALRHILEEKPDWVFSGINNGYNAGYDIAYSGTLGAAFEAVRNGVPAIAFSASSNARLETAEAYLEPVIRELLAEKPEQGYVWNVNFPARKPDQVQGILRSRTTAPVSLYTEKYIAENHPDGSVTLTVQGVPVSDDLIPEGTDAAAVRSGYISIGTVRDRVI